MFTKISDGFLYATGGWFALGIWWGFGTWVAPWILRTTLEIFK